MHFHALADHSRISSAVMHFHALADHSRISSHPTPVGRITNTTSHCADCGSIYKSINKSHAVNDEVLDAQHSRCAAQAPDRRFLIPIPRPASTSTPPPRSPPDTPGTPATPTPALHAGRQIAM